MPKIRKVKGEHIPETPEFRAIKRAAEELKKQLPNYEFCIIGATPDAPKTGFDTVTFINGGYRKLFLKALWDIVMAADGEPDDPEMKDLSEMLKSLKLH